MLASGCHAREIVNTIRAGRRRPRFESLLQAGWTAGQIMDELGISRRQAAGDMHSLGYDSSGGKKLNLYLLPEAEFRGLYVERAGGGEQAAAGNGARAPGGRAAAADTGRPLRQGEAGTCARPGCGQPFTARGQGQRYCTPAHRVADQYRRTKERNAAGGPAGDGGSIWAPWCGRCLSHHPDDQPCPLGGGENP